MLAKGDVALSVTMTATSSVITLFTLPFIMELASHVVSQQTGAEVNLPVSKLLVQNIVLLFVPIAAGAAFRRIARLSGPDASCIALFPAIYEGDNGELRPAGACNGFYYPCGNALQFAAFPFIRLYACRTQDNSHRGGDAECGTGHCNRLFSVYLQQRRDGHSRHNLRTADEHSAAHLYCDLFVFAEL